MLGQYVKHFKIFSIQSICHHNDIGHSHNVPTILIFLIFTIPHTSFFETQIQHVSSRCFFFERR